MILSHQDFLGVEFDRASLCQVKGFEGRLSCEQGLEEYRTDSARYSSYHMQKQNVQEGNTTLMIRNVPSRYRAKEFLQELCVRGFAGRFDFCYLPMDFGTAKSRGYAFVNLTDPEWAMRFHKEFHGKPMLYFNTVDKKVEIAPSLTQGLHANLCWYLERHPCRVTNPWFQPLLILQSVGKAIAYPLYELRNSLFYMEEIDRNCTSELAAEIILKMTGLETEADAMYSNQFFYL